MVQWALNNALPWNHSIVPWFYQEIPVTFRKDSILLKRRKPEIIMPLAEIIKKQPAHLNSKIVRKEKCAKQVHQK